MGYGRMTQGDRQGNLSIGLVLLVHACLWTIGETLAQAGVSGDRVIVAWDDSTSQKGFVRMVTADPPWAFASPPLETGQDGIVHVSNGKVYHVSRAAGTVSVIDVETWTVERVIEIDAASEPRDIAVISQSVAYVTRKRSTHLLRLDLVSGAKTEVVDLSIFADIDGLPKMEMMTVFEGRLFIQLHNDEPVVPPESSLLAVVDLGTEQVVDTDPNLVGVQAIVLQGTAPRFKMRVLPESRRLVVSATGVYADFGGIEVVDLDSLLSLGLLVREQVDQGRDIGPIAMISSERGAFVFSTDIVLSSHLGYFTLTNGLEFGTGGDVTTLFYFVPELLYQPGVDRLYWPDPDGLHVLAAATGELLTETPIPIAGIPTDIALISKSASIPAVSEWGLAALCGLILIAATILVIPKKSMQVKKLY